MTIVFDYSDIKAQMDRATAGEFRAILAKYATSSMKPWRFRDWSDEISINRGGVVTAAELIAVLKSLPADATVKCLGPRGDIVDVEGAELVESTGDIVIF